MSKIMIVILKLSFILPLNFLIWSSDLIKTQQADITADLCYPFVVLEIRHAPFRNVTVIQYNNAISVWGQFEHITEKKKKKKCF